MSKSIEISFQYILCTFWNIMVSFISLANSCGTMVSKQYGLYYFFIVIFYDDVRVYTPRPWDKWVLRRSSSPAIWPQTTGEKNHVRWDVLSICSSRNPSRHKVDDASFHCDPSTTPINDGIISFEHSFKWSEKFQGIC